MSNLNRRSTFVVAVILLASSGCAGTGGVPSGASASQPASLRIGKDAAARNLSGQYAGKLKDSLYGSASATASLAQYQGALGGSEGIVFGQGGVKNSLVFALTGTSLKGTAVAASKNAVCSFSTIATYNTKTHILSGSYKAVNRCAGENGTYQLKHQCLYRTGGNEDIRSENSGLHGC